MSSGDPQNILVRFDSRAYDLVALQKAAIKFTDCCAFDFQIEPDGHIAVEITFPFASSPDTNELLGQFRNEVLDQSLRMRVAEETETERNLILAYAFSNTKLISD